jgi:transcriptional regulator with XRE-family HTH domain
MLDISDMKADDMDAHIAANIAAIIKNRGLAHTRVSLDAGLSRSAVADIINRKSRSPSYATLVKIADTIGVSIEQITIGPNAPALSEDEAYIYSLVSQLPGDLRHKLTGYLEGLVESHDQDGD